MAQEEWELTCPGGCTRIFNAAGADWSDRDGRDSYRRSLLTGELVHYGGAVATARKSTGGCAPLATKAVKAAATTARGWGVCSPCLRYLSQYLDDDETGQTSEAAAPAPQPPTATAVVKAHRRSSLQYASAEQKLAARLGLSPMEAQDIVVLAEQLECTEDRALVAYRANGNDLSATVVALFEDAPEDQEEEEGGEEGQGGGAAPTGRPEIEELPFFVYGTLMRGLGNHGKLLRLAQPPLPAQLQGPHHLRHFEAGYPGLYDGSDADVGDDEEGGGGGGGGGGAVVAAVWGELAWAEDFGASLSACDALEEFYGAGDPRNLFSRVQVQVQVQVQQVQQVPEGAELAAAAAAATTTTTRAWAYKCCHQRGGEVASVPVPGGRWADFVKATGARVASDDWCTDVLGRKAGTG
jgi:gamma-glutamylcyclotransferase (GGCT)/AIG2-like uncharacterized protein YtfP